MSDSLAGRLKNLRKDIDTMLKRNGRRPQYRGPSTSERMADKLAPLFSTILETLVQPDQIHIFPARGYWTHIQQDVQPWTGHIKVDHYHVSIGSWNNLSDALRYGFELVDNRGENRRYADFEICANKTRKR